MRALRRRGGREEADKKCGACGRRSCATGKSRKKPEARTNGVRLGEGRLRIELRPLFHPYIPLCRQTNSPTQHYFLACDMSDNSQSSRIEALFESALHDYEQQTGIPLAKHPLAEQLQNCQSVDAVTTLLQEQARAFKDFRGSDRIMKSLKSVVSALSRVSAVASLGHNIGVVRLLLLIRYST